MSKQLQEKCKKQVIACYFRAIWINTVFSLRVLILNLRKNMGAYIKQLETVQKLSEKEDEDHIFG